MIKKNIAHQISEKIDAAVFPVEYESKSGKNRNEMCVFSSKRDGRILHVSIPEDAGSSVIARWSGVWPGLAVDILAIDVKNGMIFGQEQVFGE